MQENVASDAFPRNDYRIRQAGPTVMLQLLALAQPGKNMFYWHPIKAAPRVAKECCAIQALFYISFAVVAEDNLVPWRQVFKDQMLERYTQFGQRLERVITTDTGFVNWKLFGYYYLISDEDGGVVEVANINGKKAKIIWELLFC